MKTQPTLLTENPDATPFGSQASGGDALGIDQLSSTATQDATPPDQASHRAVLETEPASPDPILESTKAQEDADEKEIAARMTHPEFTRQQARECVQRQRAYDNSPAGKMCHQRHLQRQANRKR